MRRRLFAFFLVVVSFALTFAIAAPASAAVVRDGDKFSVDTGKNARICWVSPIELRNAEDCEGLTPDDVAVPQDADARVIAMGLVRLEEPDSETPNLALVMVMHVVVPLSSLNVEPDDDAAKEYADGALKGAEKELRKGAKMRPATEARIVKSPRQKHTLIRVVLDADGIPETADDRLFEHQVHVAGIADDGVYSVAFLSRREDARRIAGYADDLGPSFHMTSPAMSSKEFDKKAELIGRVIVLGFTLLVGGIISLVVVVSRRNKAAQYGYPHPYQSQSSYPPPAWHPASAQPQSAQQPQYQPRYYSIPPPPAAPRREWWNDLE